MKKFLAKKKKESAVTIPPSLDSFPDFTKKELVKAIEDYNSRDRRYGGVKEAQEGNV